MNKNSIKVLITIFLIIIILGGIIYLFNREDKDGEQTTGETLENEQENIEDEETEERKFEEEVTTPLSNSNAPAGTNVFNTFNITADDNYNLIEEWENHDDTGLKFIKITSYSEYTKIKESLTNLREMTKEDFINYFIIIVVNKDTNYIPKFERLQHNEKNREEVNLCFNKKEQEDSNSVYNGSWIVMTNKYDKYKFNFVYSEESIYE